jgi:AraC-like DNA-binding protein
MPHATPFIAMANHYHFYRKQRLGFDCVKSRMLLWCRTGYGRVTVNGRSFDLLPDECLFLPWGHAIEYRADATQPFWVAGIHVIPSCARRPPAAFEVAHTPEHPLFNARWRCDGELPGLDGIVKGSLLAKPGLAHLAEYILSLFTPRNPDEALSRTLAQLLLDELARVEPVDQAGQTLPAELTRLLTFITANLHRPLSTSDLTVESKSSASTVIRLFRRHLRMTPVEWIRGQRLEQAERLLRTTPLPVRDVGFQVGIPDPFYFSKIFKREKGVTPGACRGS